MKKILAAILSAGALLAAAPVAAASPGSVDSLYVNMLEEYGIYLGSPSATIKAGQALCSALDRGADLEDVAEVVFDNTRLTPRKAGQFIGFTIGAYCPEYRNILA